MRTQQVECIVYRFIQSQIEYLLLKRTPDKGGFWQPPCGGVDIEDASLLNAAYREIQEETGIAKDKIKRVLSNVHQFTITNNYLTGEKQEPITEYVLGFEVDSNVEVRLDANIYVEHQEFRWVNFDTAIAMLKWQDNKDAFTKLHSLLTKEYDYN